MNEHELKYILKNKLNPENFSTGQDFENVRNGTFNINLHIHTQYSDGDFSVQELLDQTAKYAEYRLTKGHDDPVIIAITDHDTLAGTQEALKIIEQSPEKYKNICFIPAIELNSFFYKENKQKKQLEVLVYYIDPFGFSNFVEKIRQTNLNYIKELATESGVVSFKYLQKHAKYVNAGGSPALMNEVTDILRNKSYKETGRIIAEHNKKYGALNINPGTPHIKELIQAVKESGSGFVSIAHPGRSLRKVNLEETISEFQEIGVEALETNYHYIAEDNVSEEIQARINQLADQTGMIKTGGIDSHRKSIFVGRESQLKEIIKINKFLT
ncbi:MAG: hypothetical protein A2Y25_02875 [Candidatus Melainabacteria bacterium GWF2_37_15]|nr:MAG: hypothetical protein A2Y25_02875 [Candidatus Melainabacteria bacterium GWF2_37_15]